MNRDHWDKIKKMSILELWNYEGDIIPWPPSDEDVLWRAWVLDEFLKDPRLRLSSQGRNWTEHRGVRMFGEYYFGLQFGLKGNTTAWERDYRVDYETPIGTIDVKTIVHPFHRLLRQVDQEKFSDILVLTLINPARLSLKNVSLLGWCYDKEILQAPIDHFSHKNPKRKDAYYRYSRELMPISDLELLLDREKAVLH